MPPRLMQIDVPQGSRESSGERLEGREILGRWNREYKGQTVLHRIVPAEKTAPIMRRLEQHFAAVERFHAILLPVETVLPRPGIDENTTDGREILNGRMCSRRAAGSPFLW